MKTSIKFFLIILFSLQFNQAKSQNQNIGCNFGITASVVVGATHSYTVGQGPWGKRKYTWFWGDNTKDSSYTNSVDITWSQHTYSLNGMYTMTITARDSATNAGCVVSGVFQVTVTGVPSSTGIHANEYNNLVNVYPNPFHNKISVSNSKCNKVEIRNILGKLMALQTCKESEIVNIETNDFESGLYFLLLYYENGTVINKRIIKQN